MEIAQQLAELLRAAGDPEPVGGAGGYETLALGSVGRMYISRDRKVNLRIRGLTVAQARRIIEIAEGRE